MKLQAVLSTVLFATIATLNINVQAAETVNASAEAKADQGTQASQPQNAASAPSAIKHAAQDKSKHYHPRDGK
jgi:hypothetical protein